MAALIVVDTNVLAELLRRQHRQWAAPLLWRSVFHNLLTIQSRQVLLRPPEAIALMQRAERIMAPHEESVTSEHVLQLVSTSRCTSYDCEFVAAAQELGVPLITEERAILAAFSNLAQSLLQPPPVDRPNRLHPVGLQRKGVNDVGGRVGDRDRICHGSTSSFKSLAA